MTRTLFAPIVAGLAASFAALGGCSSRTNVSAIGNVPGTYSHVYITAQAVWFNTSATAGPDDSGWAKFNLSTPATVDLITDSNGSFGLLVTDLKLTPGTYSQVRLIPVDPSTPLTTSAQTAGAIFNCEADYIDAQGVTQQLPLELLNPDKGVGITASLSVPVGSVGKALAASSLNSAASTTTTTTNGPFAVNAPTTTTTGASPFGTTSNTTTTRSQFALAIDAARDLSAFNVGTEGAIPTGTSIAGVMWSSHVTAYDMSKSGGIQGTLTLTNISNISAASGVPDIAASAEVLSADGTRREVVASAPVASDGTFTLSPLPADKSNITYYDVVIHGPGIATIIIKNVQIPPYGSTGNTGLGTFMTPSTTTPTTTTNPATTTTPTTTTPTTATNSTTNSDLLPPQPTNLVSVGTLTPRQTTSYTANIAQSSNKRLPAGAAVTFYQTLPGSDPAPYVIEWSPIDPFNQNLAVPQNLSAGTIDSGTYVSSGSTVAVTASAPVETMHNKGVSAYQVAATAPLYDDGTLGTIVTAPAGSSTSPPPQVVEIAPLMLAAGDTPATLSATVRAPAGSRLDQGELLVSNNGQLIATASLNNVLAAGGGAVQLTDLPGGTSSSLFYVTVRAWSSSNPSSTVTRQWSDTPVDLRSASSASIEVTLN
jgi:hypothetical protein